MDIDDINLDYLSPPRDVYQIKHDPYYIYHTDGKLHYRKLFYNVQFTQFEIEKGQQLDLELKNNKIELPKDWDFEQTVKYCYNTGFDIQKSVESVKKHIAWLNTPLYHQLNPVSLKLLKEGLFYHFGRDKQYRPIIYLNLHLLNPKEIQLDDFLSAICYLIRKIQVYTFIKGYVETQVVMIETNKKGILELNYGIIKQVIGVMALHFTSTLEKMYLLNPHFLFNNAWKLIRKMIHPETAAKITLVTSDQFQILQQNIDADQLQIKYGGTHPDLTQYWPPLDYLKSKRSPGQSNRKSLILQSLDNVNINEFEAINNDNNNIKKNKQLDKESFYSFENDSEKFFGYKTNVETVNTTKISNTEISPPSTCCCFCNNNNEERNSCVIF